MLCFRTFRRFGPQICKLISSILHCTLINRAPDLTRALDRALEQAGLPGVGSNLGRKWLGMVLALVEQAVRYVTNDNFMMKSPLCRLLLGVFGGYEPICAETSALYSGATEVIETLKAEGKQSAW